MDPRYEKAAIWYSANHDMKLPEAMRAAGFSDVDAKKRSWQMHVRRLPEYKEKGKRQTLSISVDLSLQTESSATLASVTIFSTLVQVFHR
jgi:hypothetical protein